MKHGEPETSDRRKMDVWRKTDFERETGILHETGLALNYQAHTALAKGQNTETFFPDFIILDYYPLP